MYRIIKEDGYYYLEQRRYLFFWFRYKKDGYADSTFDFITDADTDTNANITIALPHTLIKMCFQTSTVNTTKGKKMTKERWTKRKFKQAHIPNHHFWDKTEKTDKELWFEVFCAVASADNTINSDIPIRWADKALKHWRENHK